ncbi:unnamed protein product [Porites evermanni]|uniref:BZIP domain-containing protein n=1 Tax=Porites evermanni TaxID=104178 RepID=A0ABN8QSS1_9CNID|nr:unnamed protein product [Porites evermanni]
MARTYHKSRMESISLFSTSTALEGLELFNPLPDPLDGESDFLHEYNDDVYSCIEERKAPLSNLLAEDLLQELNFEDGGGLLDCEWMTERLEFNNFEPVLEEHTNSFIDMGEVGVSTIDEAPQTGEPSLKCEPVNFTFMETEIMIEANIFANVDEILRRLCADKNIPFSEGISDVPSSPLQNVPEVELHSPCSVASPGSAVSSEEIPLACSDTELGSSNPPSPGVEASPIKKNPPLIFHPVRTLPRAAYVAPYPQEKPVKEKTPQQRKRKREQNKDAATRYRIKKREEQEAVQSELSGLEKENVDLKDQVSSLSKEIEYLKNLMLEVYKTKLQKQSLTAVKS